MQQELMRFQVETATGLCTSLDDVGRDLARLRRLAAAGQLGCRVVASGTALYHAPGLAALTNHPGTGNWHAATGRWSPERALAAAKRSVYTFARALVSRLPAGLRRAGQAPVVCRPRCGP